MAKEHSPVQSPEQKATKKKTPKSEQRAVERLITQADESSTAKRCRSPIKETPGRAQPAPAAATPGTGSDCPAGGGQKMKPAKEETANDAKQQSPTKQTREGSSGNKGQAGSSDSALIGNRDGETSRKR